MGETTFVVGMRDAFFDALYPIFQRDRNCVFITADYGAPSLDRFAEELPDQYYTVGIAEQQLIGMACGMALEGRKVYTYAAAAFLALRCYEQTKLGVCAMNLPIVNVGVGRGYAVDTLGPSHHVVEDVSIMRALPNLTIWNPADATAAQALAEISHRHAGPQYIRFDRPDAPPVHEGRRADFEEGLVELHRGEDVCLIATGIMVSQAIEVRDRLRGKGVEAGVVDLCRLKPLNAQRLLECVSGVGHVVTIEEHLLAGGMGGAVAELFIDEDVAVPTLRIGQNDRFVFDLGGRRCIWEKYGLDVESITERICQWIGR